jgi:predicted HicB family RNase H-like nuclease
LHLPGFNNATTSGAEPWAVRPSRYRTTWKETFAVLTQTTEKYQSILQAARQLYDSEPDWVTFFREILGVDGIVRRQFTRLEDLNAFEKSPEFEQIQKWLVKLREQKNATDTESEPTRVITVRLPKSMHEYLRTEAHDLRTSMNKLCISKLLQVIEQDLIPAERSSGTPSRNKPAQQPQTAITGSSSSPFSSQPTFKSASGF